jgi:YggT family protein
MIWISRIIHWLFLSYAVLLFVRVVGSWFPAFRRLTIARFVSFYTDPYLNLFRRIIPPIGGALDLSPILGFFLLEISERVLLWVLHLLKLPIT